MPLIQTILWAEDGNGYIQFSTNDEDNFLTGFFKHYPTTAKNPYTDATFTIIRKSGSLTTGYGGVFCYQDGNNFYRFLINGNGSYAIAKKITGSYIAIQGWTASPDILTGYDQLNVIDIQRNDITDEFTILINGGTPINFTDPDLQSGSSGFYSYIINNDNGEYFPVDANDTRYKLTTAAPITIP